MNIPEALYYLHGLIDFSSSAHPGQQAINAKAREALALLFSTHQVPLPTEQTGPPWVEYVKATYAQATEPQAHEPPPQQQRAPARVYQPPPHAARPQPDPEPSAYQQSESAKAFPLFVQLAESIIEKCAVLMDEPPNEEAHAFAKSLKDRTQSMLDWMRQRNHCTPKMEHALTNMNEAVEKWFQAEKKRQEEAEVDSDKPPWN